jgi:hypothetical protein
VPTLIWGFVLSNFSLAISASLPYFRQISNKLHIVTSLEDFYEIPSRTYFKPSKIVAGSGHKADRNNKPLPPAPAFRAA